MKFVKKITCLFLALVMTMAMGITAFADNSYSISFNKSDSGHTYEAYQLFAGTLSEDGKTLSDVKWGNGVDGTALLAALKSDTTIGADFTDCKDGADVAKVLSDKKIDGSDDKKYSDDSDALIAFSNIVGKHLSTVAGTSTETALSGDDAGKSTYKIDNLATGYYFVKDKDNSAPSDDAYTRYILQVVENVSVTAKSEVPSIDKDIVDTDANAPLADTDNKVDSAAIGDTINYQITGKVPNYKGYDYYYYVINDTMTEGLTFQQDSVKVYVNGTQLENTATVKTYYVYFDQATNSFQVAFENIMNYTVGQEIKVTYDAVINSKAAIGQGNNVNKNTVTLTYSNKPGDSGRGDKDGKPGTPGEQKPTGKTPEIDTFTYVTELTLEKVDETGNWNAVALAGAEFTLTGTNMQQVKFTTGTSFVKVETGKGDYYKLKDGTYTTEDPIRQDTNDVKANIDKYETGTKDYKEQAVATAEVVDSAQGTKKVVATIDANGKITFTGLNVGTYTLSETHVPDGYNKADDITFTISASIPTTGDNAGKFQWSGSDNLTNNNGTFSIKIENRPGSVLPSTGGMGTTLLYVGGIAMILLAGVVVIVRKRNA